MAHQPNHDPADSDASDAPRERLGSPGAEADAAVAEGGSAPPEESDSPSPGADEDAERSGAANGPGTREDDEFDPAGPEDFGGGASD